MQRPDLEELARFVGVGSVLDGKYRIQRILGVGGMGAVVAAEHVKLGEQVAIKFLLPRGLGMQQRADRFLREARSASRLRSAHVVRVYDVDVRADDAPYLVMEYLQGETLHSALQRGPMAVAEAVDTLTEACEALAEAHALGIVHRDLKPANLFLARGAGNVVRLKVLDFGISKLLDGDGADATTGDSFLGSPPYMSPEQLTSPGDVDGRSDIWSLGVILYECLSATQPFVGASSAQICAHILQAEPTPLGDLRPELPVLLVQAVARCLQKDRAQRFANVPEFARAIAAFGSTRSERALTVVEALATNEERPAAQSSAERAANVDTGTLTAAADGSPPHSRRAPDARWGRTLLLGAMASLGGLLWLWSRSMPHDVDVTSKQRAEVHSAARPTDLPMPLPSSATAGSAPVASHGTPAKLSSVAPVGSNKAPKPQQFKTVSSAPVPSASSAQVSDPVFDERR
ncbi:MAG: serine/threonine-protein kinase [Polyangiaceae bacterium]